MHWMMSCSVNRVDDSGTSTRRQTFGSRSSSSDADARESFGHRVGEPSPIVTRTGPLARTGVPHPTCFDDPALADPGCAAGGCRAVSLSLLTCIAHQVGATSDFGVAGPGRWAIGSGPVLASQPGCSEIPQSSDLSWQSGPVPGCCAWLNRRSGAAWTHLPLALPRAPAASSTGRGPAAARASRTCWRTWRVWRRRSCGWKQDRSTVCPMLSALTLVQERPFQLLGIKPHPAPPPEPMAATPRGPSH